MQKPQLGFKLWKRKIWNKFKKLISTLFLNKLGIIFSAILAFVGIWFAYTSNELSKQSINLSKNDSNQQQQINKLRDILLEIQIQNELARAQIDQLIKIVAEANKIDISTNKLILGSNAQTELLYQQLLLSRKNDSVANISDLLTSESDLLSLRKVFEEIRDVNMVVKVMNLFLSTSPDVNTLIDLRIKFEKGLNNRIFLTDTIIKSYWYEYYQKLKVAEDRVKVFNAQGRPSTKAAEFKNIGKKIRDEYFFYVNKIWPRLDYLEDIFRNRNF